jgi:hypothetical protein
MAFGARGRMNGGRDKRLGKLELKRRPVARTFYLWRDGAGETLEQAIARSFPDGVPQGARLVIYSWQSAEGPVRKPEAKLKP